jgi:uncharacterized protein
MLDSRRKTLGRSAHARAGQLALWCVWLLLAGSSPVRAQDARLPDLTAPVLDLANVIDAETERALGDLSRRLQAASNDVLVVVTVPTYAPYGDIREYAVELFENHGRGIGERGKDNGVLILLALEERRVWVEVGYGLEEWITDGFAGEVSRERMVPAFRTGNYGAGLLAGALQIAGRIAQGRNVTLEGVPAVRARRRPELSTFAMVVIFIMILLLSRSLGGPGRRGRRFRRGVWSSGVGPFGGGWTGGGFGGGGFGGGFGGGGFGGGFGGFGGGRSGGGGGGASW